MHMNMKARVSDGLAPVARVYMPVRATVQRDLARLAAGLFPKTEQSLSISPYSMPRCRPDRASMCEAPLFRKSSTVSLSRWLLSPQISALTRAAQASFLNPILSTAAESMSPAPLANPPEPAAELKGEPASSPQHAEASGQQEEQGGIKVAPYPESQGGEQHHAQCRVQE